MEVVEFARGRHSIRVSFKTLRALRTFRVWGAKSQSYQQYASWPRAVSADTNIASLLPK